MLINALSAAMSASKLLHSLTLPAMLSRGLASAGLLHHITGLHAERSAIASRPCNFKLGLPVLQIDGRVTYNGHTFNDFLAQRTAAYVEQEDQHM